MKQKYNHQVFNRFTVGAFAVVIVAAAVFTLIVTKQGSIEAAPAIKPAMGSTVPSVFSFNGLAGWWQGATNKTSMALFQDSHDCFTSAQYMTGSVDAATELQNEQNSMTSSGYTSTPVTVSMIAVQTSAGRQQYQLHQYAESGTGNAGQVEGGQEFGYLQLTNGYIKFEGYCDTASELAATIPALQAIEYTE